MAQKIDKILLQLEMKGFPLVKGFAKDIQSLGQSLSLSRPDIANFAKELNNFENQLGKVGEFKTQKQFNTQISLLKKLQNNVAKGSAAYNELGLAIRNVASEMSNPKLGRVGTAALKEYQRRGNLGRNEALERGTGSFKGFSQRATEITTRANLAASGRAFLASADAQLRPISGLAEQIQQIGLAKVDAQFQRLGQSVSKVRRDILAAAKAGGNNVNALNAQRAALETLRNGVELGSQKFKQLTRDIQGVERRLNSLTKFSGKSLLGAGQGLLGATFVGGGSGLVGGLAGMGVEALRPGGNLQQGAITGGLIGSQLIQPLAGAISESAQYTASLDKAKIALRGLIGNEVDFQIALDAANTATEEFNVPQEVAIKGMQRLSAAVIGAGGNVNNAKEAFLNTIAAIKATGGTADDVKSAITAMVQIFSKGRVSAEELSGQLGERFPAAVTQFAKANNMNTETLQASLKAGTVGLDMLSKFVAFLGVEYVDLAKAISDSPAEAGARLVIATNKMRLAVGENFKGLGADIQTIQAQLITELAPTIGELAKIAVRGFKILSETLKFVVNNFDALSPVIAGSTVALVGFNIQAQIANRTGIVLMARNALAGMIKLTRAIKAATISQTAFNTTVDKNKYVIAAAAIATIATALFNVKRAADSLNDDEIFVGFESLNLEQTKAALKDVKEQIKRNQEILKNPTGIPEIGLSAEAQVKTASGMLKKLTNELIALQTRIFEITGEHEGKAKFAPAVGANTKTQELLNLETGLIKAMKDKNKELQLETKLKIELEKLDMKFDKKMKQTGEKNEDGTNKLALSKEDAQDKANQTNQLNLKYESDLFELKMKQKTVNQSILHELGLITDKKKEEIDLQLRAAEIAKFHKDILKKNNLVTEEGNVKMKELIELLKQAKIDATKFGEAGVLDSFKEELENVGTAMENIVVNGFTKMEDALTNFVMTGKLNFRNLANSIISDLTRMYVRAAITKPLFDFLFPSFASGGVIGNDVQGFGGQQVMKAAKGQVMAQNKIVPYAYGGTVVRKPTLFPMADGMGLMGEAGAEAIMPLRRNKQGKLGVEASGATSNNVVNVSVDASGSSAQGNNMKANQLGKLIGSAIQAELVKQKRPGGILYE